jgi:YD repeat-containing protein
LIPSELECRRAV